MTLALGVLGLFAIVMLVLVLAGRLLPPEHEVRMSFDMQLGADEVWRRLTDFEHMPMAGRMARGVARLPDEKGLPAWEEDLGTTKVSVRTIECEPGRKLVRSMADAKLPLQAVWSAEVEPRSSGRTRVTLTNRTAVADGPMASMIRLSVRLGGLRAGLRHFAKRLAGDAPFDVAA